MSTLVWVTGASGFIGKATIREAVRLGWSVGAIGHGKISSVEAQHLRVSAAVDGSISLPNLNHLRELTGCPDCVIHLAGGASVGKSLTQPLEDFYRTIESTAALLEWIRLESSTSSIVYISSAAVYGAAATGPVNEDAICQPYSPYGSHKLMAEQLVQARARDFGLKAAIVRPFSVYGPGLMKQLIYDLCVRLANNQEELVFDGTGEELRDWTYISDVASLLCEFTNHVDTSASRWNLGTGSSTSVKSIVELVCELWPKKIPIRFTGRRRAGDPDILVADTSKTYSLGIQSSVLLNDGMRQTVAWYQKFLTDLSK